MARTPWKCHQPEARIAAVEPESIADELELQPGDIICAVNGEPLTDYIAYRFAIADEVVTLEVARGEDRWEIEIEKEADEDLGIAFTSDVFDGVRACRNNCVFCFEQQMPAGMRRSLTLRDDDYRLSFLHGNFLTLTNVADAELQRIIREHLSPLFVSVHATDPVVRQRMLRTARLPDIRDQLRQLGAGGIEVHTQIVLCPGWNDGAVLEQTLDDLAALYPTVLSVGIVPVGLTGHRPAGPEMHAVTPEEARAVLATVERRQAALLPRIGTRLIFAADEFYLAAGHPFPPAETYEGFEQYENGIGMARRFLDELAELTIPADLPAGKVTLVTGMLAAPLVAQLAARLRAAGVGAEVAAVPNLFYGGGVSVAGLLTYADLVAGLAGRDLGQRVILPATARNADGIFLDDHTPAELADALGVPVAFAGGPEDVIALLAE